MVAISPAITVRMMEKKDFNEAAVLISSTMAWARETYGRNVVSKKALAYYIAYGTKQLSGVKKDPSRFCFLALDTEKVCGMSLGGFACGVGTIDWLAVDPDYQGKGLGERLLEATEDMLVRKGCHKMTFVTYPFLIPAINLYLKRGMVPEAFLRKDVFGEDRIVMSKWFEEGS